MAPKTYVVTGCSSGIGIGGGGAASSGNGADVLYIARRHFASRSALVDILQAVEKELFY